MSTIRLPPIALEVVKDEQGSVTMGWVGDRVFYARFAGLLSMQVGMAHLACLQGHLRSTSALHYFSDSSAMTQYELRARSAFTRLVLENRRKFSTLVMLTWSGGITPASAAFSAAVGGSVTLVTDAIQFEKLLVAAAPFARERIDSRAWVNTSASNTVRR